MEQKDVNLIKDFAVIIHDLCLQKGYKNIVGCEVIIEEMRDNGIVIREQRADDIYNIPIDYRRDIPTVINKESLKVADAFDYLLYYHPSETKDLFAKELLSLFGRVA